MTKYLCLCGVTFKRRKYAEKHAALFTDLEPENTYHIIIKKLWRARLLDFFLDYPWGRFFRLTGVFTVLMVVEHHFDVNFTVWESVFFRDRIGASN
jgi:hypothetical protein